MAAYVHLEPSSPDWEAAWSGLGRGIVANGLGDGSDVEQASSGEVWQLVSSWADGDYLRHEFRHRSHPETGGKFLMRVAALRQAPA